MQEETESNTLIKGDFNRLLSIQDRKFGWKISYVIDDLNNIVNMVGIWGINRQIPNTCN